MIQTGSILRARRGAETTVHGVEKQTISRKKIKEFKSKSYDLHFWFSPTERERNGWEGWRNSKERGSDSGVN